MILSLHFPLYLFSFDFSYFFFELPIVCLRSLHLFDFNRINQFQLACGSTSNGAMASQLIGYLMPHWIIGKA